MEKTNLVYLDAFHMLLLGWREKNLFAPSLFYFSTLTFQEISIILCKRFLKTHVAHGETKLLGMPTNKSSHVTWYRHALHTQCSDTDVYTDSYKACNIL